MKLLGTTTAQLESNKEGIHVSGDQVCFSNTTMVTATTAVEKLVCLVAAHSVMNMAFPKKNAAFLSYVQYFMLGIDDGIKLPQRALKIHQELI